MPARKRFHYKESRNFFKNKPVAAIVQLNR